MRAWQVGSVVVEFTLGTGVEEAAEWLTALATRLDVPCKADFNGTPMTALPGHTWTETLTAFVHLRDLLATVRR